MDLGLKGRLALITGSTRGLGRAIAEALAQEGVEVIINGRNEESVTKTMLEISVKYRIQTWACPVDVTDGKAIKTFFELGPVAAKGRLDILVNNVGNIEKFGNFTDLEDEDWIRCYNLTFMSAVRFTREALPFLTASGNGKVINISSLISHQPGDHFPHYAPAKAALNNLTKYLAGHLGIRNICVNAICPSNVDWDKNLKDKVERDGISIAEAVKIISETERNKSPLGVIGIPEDVANLAVYLASNKAEFLTGHIYNVDGGITKGV